MGQQGISAKNKVMHSYNMYISSMKALVDSNWHYVIIGVGETSCGKELVH